LSKTLKKINIDADGSGMLTVTYGKRLMRYKMAGKY